MAKGSFSLDITKFIEKTKLKADVVLRKLSLDGLRKVILKSPVDTGRFRANWRVTIGAIDSTWFDVPEKPDGEKPSQGAPDDGPGRAALAKGQATIGKAKFGSIIYITNSVPYATKLEGGHSRQAPDGILFPSYNELRAEFSAVVDAVRRQA